MIWLSFFADFQGRSPRRTPDDYVPTPPPLGWLQFTYSLNLHRCVFELRYMPSPTTTSYFLSSELEGDLERYAHLVSLLQETHLKFSRQEKHAIFTANGTAILLRSTFVSKATDTVTHKNDHKKRYKNDKKKKVH